MRVKWGVEDGYVGKFRSHHVDVPDEEIAECDSLKEAIELVYDCVQDAFEQNITWFCDPDTDELEELLKKGE